MRVSGLLVLFGLMTALPAMGEGEEPQIPWSVSQSDFDSFMRCYGHMSGSLDLLGRIRPEMSDPTQIEAVRRAGIELMNERFAAPYDRLVETQSHLDLFDGEQARHEGRLPFDSLEMTGVSLQYERFRTQGPLSDACLSVSDKIKAQLASPRRTTYTASLSSQD